MEKNAIRQEPSAPKVEVVLYYESLCPYSIRYYTQILYPTYMLLNEIMELRLIPYGNTRVRGHHVMKTQDWYMYPNYKS